MYSKAALIVKALTKVLLSYTDTLFHGLISMDQPFEKPASKLRITRSKRDAVPLCQ